MSRVPFNAPTLAYGLEFPFKQWGPKKLAQKGRVTRTVLKGLDQISGSPATDYRIFLAGPRQLSQHGKLTRIWSTK